MLAALYAAQALAGDLYVVRSGPEGAEFERVDTTRTGDAALVTWPGQALEMVVLTDLSGSISDDEARRMGDTLDTLYEALLERRQPGDRVAVTAFGGKVQRWVPMGRLARPSLASWIERFGRPRAAFRPSPLAYGDDPDAIPVPPDPRALDRAETDAARALDAATADLRRGAAHALKAVVLLWDGGHNGWGDLQAALDRAWAHEIHVWSVSFTRPLGPLVTRGAGDAYVVSDSGPAVAERIARELRFDP